MLKSLYIIHKSGVMLFEKQFEESVYEIKELVTAFFSALIVFTERSLQFGEIKELRCSSVKLLFNTAKEDQFFVVIAVDQFDDAKAFDEFIKKVQQSFKKLYEQVRFKGKIGTYVAFEKRLEKIVKDTIPYMLFNRELEDSTL
ncbi:MAG: hypothetical protein ACFFD4_20915 [Candidatus Odinarchaeota archaeon]